MKAFNLRLREGGMGLFYFAGHGVQADGENYLIPINARIAHQRDIALPMGRVIGAMEDANNGLNILILDACRNMPFSRSWRSSQGLAAPPTARGMLIAYATSPGGMAADGAGENGVYTKYLLQTMALPGLSIEQVFKQVRYGVVAETEGSRHRGSPPPCWEILRSCRHRPTSCLRVFPPTPHLPPIRRQCCGA